MIKNKIIIKKFLKSPIYFTNYFYLLLYDSPWLYPPKLGANSNLMASGGCIASLQSRRRMSLTFVGHGVILTQPSQLFNLQSAIPSSTTQGLHLLTNAWQEVYIAIKMNRFRNAIFLSRMVTVFSISCKIPRVMWRFPGIFKDTGGSCCQYFSFLSLSLYI